MKIARISKACVAFGLALFAFVAVFNNITDFDTNFAFVNHVLRMDTTAPDNPLMYRAVTNESLLHAVFFGIIAIELAVGLSFFSGAVSLWRARHASPIAFAQARQWIYVGAMLAFLLWYVGFLVVAGEWFLMRQSKSWNTMESAFRTHVAMFLALIYISQSEPHQP